jgi:hypothetical protein
MIVSNGKRSSAKCWQKFSLEPDFTPPLQAVPVLARHLLGGTLYARENAPLNAAFVPYLASPAIAAMGGRVVASATLAR